MRLVQVLPASILSIQAGIRSRTSPASKCDIFNHKAKGKLKIRESQEWKKMFNRVDFQQKMIIPQKTSFDKNILGVIFFDHRGPRFKNRWHGFDSSQSQFCRARKKSSAKWRKILWQNFCFRCFWWATDVQGRRRRRRWLRVRRRFRSSTGLSNYRVSL